MKTLPCLVAAALVASPAIAETARQLDAHEHGVGTLDIAFEGEQVAMEFHAPGADIVGFEYEATSAEDVAAIEAAIQALSKPLDLFAVPSAAGCEVTMAEAELETEEDHDDHDDHGEDKDHDDHDDHGEDEGHDDHDDHGEDKEHDDHDDHDDHAEKASHTQFHATYALTCSGPVSQIDFAYFEMFPNAVEVEVQIVTDAGATAFEVERDSPTLDLSDLL